jgi:dihydrofolate reductase
MNASATEEVVTGRLIVSAQITMDSVMDHMEGWFDPELESQEGIAQLRAEDGLILGRKTYEGPAAYWPSQKGGYAELVNPILKYVASRTIKEPLTWNSQLLGTDPAEGVAALKARYKSDLISYRCEELANYLARRGLVDEVRFWLHPRGLSSCRTNRSVNADTDDASLGSLGPR